MGVMSGNTNRNTLAGASSSPATVATPLRERKLASIQTISDIRPIENADAIEVARVLGWNVVVKKGEFKAGDECIYCEVDSLLPQSNPAFDFLTENGDARLRTVKLRGQVSQGICFPKEILPEGDYSVGDDVSELLGITKYEAPIPPELQGKMKGGFPAFISKTDEPRVQTLDFLLKTYQGTPCKATEKLDGNSTTMYLNHGEFGVCSRTIDLLETKDSFLWNMARKYNVEEELKKDGRNLAIQGETIGSGIMKNKYKLPEGERRFYVFTILDIDTQEYLNHSEVEEFCEKHNLLMVPTVEDFPLPGDSDSLVELSKGKSVINPQIRREGIVIRPHEEIDTMEIGRFSIKAINPDFLLKYGE